MRKFYNLKALIFAFQVAFVFCFSTGIFWNPPVRVQAFDENRWYYINRGYPTSWAGVSEPSFSVDFPIIKAPFLTREVLGTTHTKIIDLRIFLPLFFTVFLMAYSFALVFSKAAEEKSLKIIIIPIYILLTILLTLGCIFFYFFWFPRI